eukprot:8867978-Alexandrium_andersonii.AAC.1
MPNVANVAQHDRLPTTSPSQVSGDLLLGGCHVVVPGVAASPGEEEVGQPVQLQEVLDAEIRQLGGRVRRARRPRR